MTIDTNPDRGDTFATVEHLIETLANGRLGFSAGAEKLRADDHPDLAGTFLQLARERGALADELRSVAGLERTGADGDASDGTMAGSLHRAWLKLKDALSGDDPHAVLDAAEQGEDHALSEIADALAGDLPIAARPCVLRIQGEVKAAHDLVRGLRDAAE